MLSKIGYDNKISKHRVLNFFMLILGPLSYLKVIFWADYPFLFETILILILIYVRFLNILKFARNVIWTFIWKYWPGLKWANDGRNSVVAFVSIWNDGKKVVILRFKNLRTLVTYFSPKAVVLYHFNIMFAMLFFWSFDKANLESYTHYGFLNESPILIMHLAFPFIFNVPLLVFVSSIAGSITDWSTYIFLAHSC